MHGYLSSCLVDPREDITHLLSFLHQTGIVSVFFCGISARRYIVPNVSVATRKSSETIFQTAAYIAETCIFLELGLSVFGLPASSFNWMFILWAFVASLVGRAVGIYPIVFLHNMMLKERVPDVDPTQLTAATTVIELPNSFEANSRNEDASIQSYDSSSVSSGSICSGSQTRRRRRKRRRTPPKRKDKQISLTMTNVMWFAGLRGAVAYACVRKFPNLYGHADEFTAATMVIVLVSLVIMGGATGSLLRALDIEMDVDEEEYMKEWHSKRALKGWFHDLGT